MDLAQALAWVEAHPLIVSYIGLGVIGAISRAIAPGDLQARLDKNPVGHAVLSVMAAFGLDIGKLFAIATGFFEAMGKRADAPKSKRPPSVGAGGATLAIACVAIAASVSACASFRRQDANDLFVLGSEALDCVAKNPSDDAEQIAKECGQELAPDALLALIRIINHQLEAKNVAACRRAGISFDDAGAVIVYDAGAK